MHSQDLPVALVLGAKVHPDGRPSRALNDRAHHGAALWLRGDVRAIVATGRAVPPAPSEADVIAGICEAQGVPRSAMILEEQAANTEENLRFAIPLLENLSAQSVVVVTDAAHGRRVRLLARRMGLQVRVSVPAVRTTVRRAVIRHARELMAFGYYWLRGAGR